MSPYGNHPPHLIAGKQAEVDACQFLQNQNLTLITKNYNCYYGEIDLVMRDKECIVFVEVRKRNRIDYGSAIESINKAKQKKLIKTATHFLMQKKMLYKVPSRFDIVAIHPAQGKIQIEWIKNAFGVDKY